jgi:hypothetical protein
VNDRRVLLLGLLACALGLRPSNAVAAADLAFHELYTTGVTLSPKALALAGQTIVMSGYMAPPLKAEASFFVLTRAPMSVCPFCDSQMDWPDDIVFVRMGETVPVSPFNQRIDVKGVLDVGFQKDAETGFVSFVRLMGASYDVA